MTTEKPNTPTVEQINDFYANLSDLALENIVFDRAGLLRKINEELPGLPEEQVQIILNFYAGGEDRDG